MSNRDTTGTTADQAGNDSAVEGHQDRADDQARTSQNESIISALADALERLVKFVAMHGECYHGATADATTALAGLKDVRDDLGEPTHKVSTLDNAGAWKAAEAAK